MKTRARSGPLAHDLWARGLRARFRTTSMTRRTAAFLRLRTADFLALFELHHGRRKHFRQRIVKPPFLNDAQLGDAASYSRCRDPISYSEWRELRNVMPAELETCPAGDTVLAGLGIWPAALVCWATKCKNVPFVWVLYTIRCSCPRLSSM